MTANFQISGKAPDGRIYVIGGDNYPEFAANLQEMYGPQADRVLEDFQFLLDPPSAPAVANAQPLRGNAPSPAQSSAGSPAPGAPLCEGHGQPRQFKSSKPGAPKQWSAWFCAVPKEQGGCAPLWQ